MFIRFRDLYGDYRKEAFFWEIAVILERTLIIIIMKLFNENNILKGLFSLIILITYSLSFIKIRPYRFKLANRLALFSKLI